MFFYLDYIKKQGLASNPHALPNGEKLPDSTETGVLYLQKGKQQLSTHAVAGGQFLLLGDPVFARAGQDFRTIVPEPGVVRQDVLFREVKGHYYWFYLRENECRCGSSFGAIFPVYYHLTGERVTISSSSFALAERIQPGAPDKRNLLERLLFNYPFFQSTWWTGIKLLDTHRFLHLNPSGIALAGTFEISDYFGSPDKASAGDLADIARLFQSETGLFFPDDPFGISFTGGFDGRTLVAAAKKDRRDFFTYSFGRPDSTDVTSPSAQAAQLGIPYFPILLDEQYVAAHSYDSAWSFMRQTDFNGNFGRPHYHYAAGVLSKKTNYMLTGNFGSELFRALHIPGVMMSECLIRVFADRDHSWKDFLRQSVQALDGAFFQKELDELIADIERYTSRMEGWDANRKFYYFVFNEIFRKYFGPEIVMQSYHMNNRTPYLNLSFIEQLNRTIWSGVHSRLFEKMKSKRMKGQQFYATFIRYADPELYQMNTNKGYSPADTLESIRFPLLVTKVLTHKYLMNKEIDDNSVSAFFSRYHSKIAEQIKGDTLPPFLLSRLGASTASIAEARQYDGWIKLYSIASGWNAAMETAPARVHL